MNRTLATWTTLLLLAAQTALAAPVKILFIGNSYTGQIRKPLQGVFKAAGVEAEMAFITPGGCTLQKHADNEKTLARIAEGWNFVVLQEQSQIPSFPNAPQTMHPPGEKLHQAIRKTGAQTVLYLTWGRKAGDKRNRPDDDFEAMQQRLIKGYLGLAKKTRAKVAPVGPAWALARGSFDLWKKDGSHPNNHGAYLAACVLLQTLTGKAAPAGYTAGLPAAEALQLRRHANAVRAWKGSK